MKIMPALSRAIIIGLVASGSLIISVYHRYPDTYAHHEGKLFSFIETLKETEPIKEIQALPERTRSGLSLEVLNTEDFVLWTQEMLKSFPNEEDLKIRNRYSVRRDLVGAGQKLSELAHFLKENPQWKHLGAQFLNQCANKHDIIGAVRGLCLARMESMLGEVGGENTYKP